MPIFNGMLIIPLISTNSPVTEFAVRSVFVMNAMRSRKNNLATLSFMRLISEPLSKNDVKILSPVGIFIMTRKF